MEKVSNVEMSGPNLCMGNVSRIERRGFFIEAARRSRVRTNSADKRFLDLPDGSEYVEGQELARGKRQLTENSRYSRYMYGNSITDVSPDVTNQSTTDMIHDPKITTSHARDDLEFKPRPKRQPVPTIQRASLIPVLRHGNLASCIINPAKSKITKSLSMQCTNKKFFTLSVENKNSLPTNKNSRKRTACENP